MGQPAELPGTPLHSSKVPDLPQRAAHQQTVPVADDFDLPPSYEASIHVSGTRARSNRSSVSSTADPHDGLLGAELHASAPQASASAARVDVDTKGYCRTDPMVWAELERSGKWEKHGGKPGPDSLRRTLENSRSPL
ncbi:Fc.00g030300.m01.CDS01 [Cosmosporella sp. VM-42]